MIKYLLITVFLFSGIILPSFLPLTLNPSSVRTGNIEGFKPGDTVIPFTSQNRSFIAAGYMVPFGITELSTQYVTWSGSFGKFPAAVSMINFGNEYYRENTASVSAAVYSATALDIVPGFKIYNMKNIKGNNVSFGIDLSSQYRFSERLKASVSVNNIYRHETDDLDIPLTGFASLRFSASDEFIFYTGLEKSDRTKAVFKSALEYIPAEILTLSAGYNFEPEIMTAGISLKYRSLCFDYALSYHFELSYSHYAGIIYEL